MTSHRKLAAILCADAAGYSRLMADDEEATVRSLNEARALFRVRVEAHGGRLIDTAGDTYWLNSPVQWKPRTAWLRSSTNLPSATHGLPSTGACNFASESTWAT